MFARMDSLIAQTQTLHRLTFGHSLREERDMDELLRRLQEGETDLPLVLEWEPGHYHLVVLKALREERVVFFNPDRPAMAPTGSTLVQDGPPRRVEDGQLQSLSLADFRTLLQQGQACGLVT